MDEERFIDAVLEEARKQGYSVELNRNNKQQIDFGKKHSFKKLHEEHLSNLYPEILNKNVNIGNLIETVAPGRPCTHRPMIEIIANIKVGRVKSSR